MIDTKNVCICRYVCLLLPNYNTEFYNFLKYVMLYSIAMATNEQVRVTTDGLSEQP